MQDLMEGFEILWMGEENEESVICILYSARKWE
jgi:hypothetical protein